jgi:hypothetical protein
MATTIDKVDSFIINGVVIPKFDKTKTQFYTYDQVQACGGLEAFKRLIGYTGNGSIDIDITEEEYQAMQKALKEQK